VASLLDERGRRQYAATAYALAYTSTSTEFNDPFGGGAHEALLTRAHELGPEEAHAVYGEAVLNVIRAQIGPLDVAADIMRRRLVVPGPASRAPVTNS